MLTYLYTRTPSADLPIIASSLLENSIVKGFPFNFSLSPEIPFGKKIMKNRLCMFFFLRLNYNITSKHLLFPFIIIFFIILKDVHLVRRNFT